MSDIPAIWDGLIQFEETQFKAADSEYTQTRLGANLNFVYTNHIFSHTFKINGPAGSFNGKTGIDGMFILPYNAYIINALIYIEINGSSGNLQFDVQYSPTNGAGWTSIFSTQPVVSYSAGNDISAGVGDVVSGVTAPVLTSSQVSVVEKGRLKMNMAAVPGGFPENCGMTIFYRVR